MVENVAQIAEFLLKKLILAMSGPGRISSLAARVSVRDDLPSPW
jgi:hypothetical protein